MNAFTFSNSMFRTVLPNRRRAASCVLALIASIGTFDHLRVAEATLIASGFGPFGESGELNGHPITFGREGNVFEMDAFVAVSGTDLNSDSTGTSASLSNGVPSFVSALSFSHILSPTGSELQLKYKFTCGTSPVDGLSFFFYVDPEVSGNLSYTDEYAVVLGAPGRGSSDGLPDTWEIDEPGFAFGDIYSHLQNGSLDNENGVPIGAPDDVSMAFGFSLGNLRPKDSVDIRILMSDAGAYLGSFALAQHDTRNPFDVITISGLAQVTRFYPGDYDNNGVVDEADFVEWRRSFGSTTNLNADGNGDGLVDTADYVVWRDHLGLGTRLAGDYDGNGIVSGEDYQQWRQDFGSTTNLSSDGNGDGQINAADYILWRVHSGSYGAVSTGTSALAVPEPKSIATMMITMLCVWVWLVGNRSQTFVSWRPCTYTGQQYCVLCGP